MWPLNPFKKHDVSEFPGVLVPLDQGPRRSSSWRATHSSPATASDKGDADEKSTRADSDNRSTAPSVAVGGAGLTLEQLRQHVEEDLAAGDQQTAYDRKFSA